MTRSGTSDLGLTCLVMPHKKDARLKWVKIKMVYSKLLLAHLSHRLKMSYCGGRQSVIHLSVRLSDICQQFF